MCGLRDCAKDQEDALPKRGFDSGAEKCYLFRTLTTWHFILSGPVDSNSYERCGSQSGKFRSLVGNASRYFSVKEMLRLLIKWNSDSSNYRNHVPPGPQ
ncbi:hypothetical protein MRX96_051625 [Rhipicephalus microplus]